MKRVAVFGNTGGGKSTLARQLADRTRLPLYPLDLWIIDGFGSVASAWERFSRADTLVYVDLPLVIHYWWVTKRLIKGLFAKPEGWPDNSPLWRSTLSCYRNAWLCHRRLTPRYRQLLAEAASAKRVHHLKSAAEMATFLEAIRRQ